MNKVAELTKWVASHRTQREAAKALGLSTPHLCLMLQGKRAVNDTVMEKMGFRWVKAKR